jgi:hypothetical protein
MRTSDSKPDKDYSSNQIDNPTLPVVSRHYSRRHKEIDIDQNRHSRSRYCYSLHFHSRNADILIHYSLRIRRKHGQDLEPLVGLGQKVLPTLKDVSY